MQDARTRTVVDHTKEVLVGLLITKQRIRVRKSLWCDRPLGVAVAPDTPAVALPAALGHALAMSHDLEALRALYREADEALDGWTCDVSLDCCHFARTGREPHLWPNEWELLQRAVAANGRRRGPLLAVFEDRRCPLLDDHGRCSVYEARPFGCRTFFCERAVGSTRKLPRAELAAIGRRIADLAQREQPACDGPRTLTSLLRSRK